MYLLLIRNSFKVKKISLLCKKTKNMFVFVAVCVEKWSENHTGGRAGGGVRAVQLIAGMLE